MALRHQRIPFTSDSDGNVVAYGETGVNGYVMAIFYDFGDIAADADFVITYDQGYGVAEAILTLTDQAAADAWFYPRRLVQDEAGADLTGAAGGDRVPYLMMGRPKITGAQAGDIKSGAFIIFYEEHM